MTIEGIIFLVYLIGICMGFMCLLTWADHQTRHLL
jgi:hypothetical protein